MPDWDFDEDGNEETPTGGDENKNFKELRNYSKKLEREQKAALAELEELRAYKAERVTEMREQTLSNVVKEAGLPSFVSNVYKAMNPDVEPEAITPEVVFNFAKEQGIVAVESPTPPAAEPAKVGFEPLQTVGQPSPLATLSAEDVQKLMAAGKYDEVNRAVKEGRVEKPSVPWTR